MIENDKKINLQSLKQELSGCFCITDDNLFKIYKQYLPESTFVLPSGEQCKSFEYVQKIINKMLSLSIDRSGCIAAVGGGTVGDIAGFCASIYKRGINWIVVPTTVTAFADSSIGGKTSINFGDIKNSVGSFYLPKKRIVCYDFLETLPKDQIQNGLVEVYKTALLDKSLFKIVWTAPLECLLDKAAKIKSKIVSSDFLDNGKRQVLNLGHTIGHALELTTSITHGRAVAIGLLIETLFCSNCSKKVLDFVKKVAMPFLPLVKFDIDAIVKAASNDKKNKDGIVIFIAKDIEDIQKIKLTKQEFKQRLVRVASQIGLKKK